MSEHVRHLTKSDFASVIKESPNPVLVDFWAPWCGPCRMIAPELEAAAGELQGKATVAKVNVDEEPELAEEYGVTSIPKLVVFKAGEITREMMGFHNKKAIVEALGV